MFWLLHENGVDENSRLLVRFRVTDGGQASEPAGDSSRSLRCSVTRAAIEDSVPYLLPIFKSKEVKLLCVKSHPE